MSLVPSMDLRDQPPADGSETQIIPSNIEAEQALIGILIYEPEQLWQLPNSLTPEAFYEPLHGRMFKSIRSCLSAGLSVDPISLGDEFMADPGFKELGGMKYVVALVEHSPPADNAAHYAGIIVEMFTRRQLIGLGKSLVQDAMGATRAEGGAGQIISDLERDLLGLTLGSSKLVLTDSKTATASVLEWVRNKSGPTGILTGLAPLDLQLGIILPDDLVVVGGRPGVGKSGLALCVGARIAAPQWWAANRQEAPFGDFDPPAVVFGADRQTPKGVIFVNGEMSVQAMTRRIVSDVGFQLFGKAFPEYQDLRKRRVTEDQDRMLDEVYRVVADWPIRYIKRTGLKFSELRSLCRRQTAEWARQGIELGLTVGDHAGLFKGDGKFSSLREEQTQIAQASKEFAGETGAPFMMLVQLSRGVEGRDDKRPQLSDLKESGAWEESADFVLFPYREAHYARSEKEGKSTMEEDQRQLRMRSKKLEVGIAKIREGEAGTAPVLWADMGHNAIRGVEPYLAH